MPPEVTLSSAGFPVVDVTHRPKRLQADSIVASGKAFQTEAREDAEESAMSCVPLHNVTIERAIAYYEANAEGSLQTLYLNTAKWLRQLAGSRKSAIESERDCHEDSKT